jgi:hypothetical protein
MSTSFPGLQSIMDAITREENVNPVYNNPGALTNSSGGLIQYNSIEEGNAAFQNQILRAVSGQSQYYSPDMSIQQFENTYTGGDTNAGKNVASFLGVSPNTSIGSVASSAPASSASPSQIGSGGTSGLPTWASSILAAANDAIGNNSIAASIRQATGQSSGATKIPFLNLSVFDIVAVVAGIVLLAGAVFGFRNVGNTVVETARRGAEFAA